MTRVLRLGSATKKTPHDHRCLRYTSRTTAAPRSTSYVGNPGRSSVSLLRVRTPRMRRQPNLEYGIEWGSIVLHLITFQRNDPWLFIL